MTFISCFLRKHFRKRICIHCCCSLFSPWLSSPIFNVLSLPVFFSSCSHSLDVSEEIVSVSGVLILFLSGLFLVVESQGWEELFNPTIQGLQCSASYPLSEPPGFAEILQSWGMQFLLRAHSTFGQRWLSEGWVFWSIISAASVYPLVIVLFPAISKSTILYLHIYMIRPITFILILFYLSKISPELSSGHRHPAHLFAHASVWLKAFKNWFLELIAVFLRGFSLLLIFFWLPCLYAWKLLYFREPHCPTYWVDYPQKSQSFSYHIYLIS